MSLRLSAEAGVPQHVSCHLAAKYYIALINVCITFAVEMNIRACFASLAFNARGKIMQAHTIGGDTTDRAGRQQSKADQGSNLEEEAQSRKRLRGGKTFDGLKCETQHLFRRPWLSLALRFHICRERRTDGEGEVTLSHMQGKEDRW